VKADADAGRAEGAFPAFSYAVFADGYAQNAAIIRINSQNIIIFQKILAFYSSL
jgi:hypothetical protein